MRHLIASVMMATFTPLFAATEYHVGPRGDDTHPGTKEKPFATIRRASEAVRVLKKQGDLRDEVIIRIHGDQTLKEPLILRPEDSGTRRGRITYRGEAKGQAEVPATISGGRKLTGWKKAEIEGKKLWILDLPEVRDGKWNFHQLWIDGKRRPRARHPNSGFLTIERVPDVTPGMPYNVGQKRFQYGKGDIKAMKNLEDVDVIVLHLWVSVRLAVSSLEEKDRLVNFRQKSKRKLTDGNEAARYWVENALELLDTPGEWYLDRKAGRLHYWPMPGEEIDRVSAVAPVLPFILKLEGKPGEGNQVEHVRFENLTFADAEWWPQRDDPADVQAAASVPAVVQGDFVRHCEFVNCQVTRASGYGIHLAQGCQHCAIRRCTVHDLGAGGVRVGETQIREDLDRQTHGIRLEHCTLHGLGRLFPQAVGVWIGQSYKNLVTNNDIHDLYYTGISCGWTWGYGKTLARDNLMENNRVHTIGQGLLSDMAGVYTLGTQPGTIIRNNVFHDITAHRYGGWGIYFDEGSTDIVAERNLVYSTTHGGFHQHYGKENVVRHNIFALGRDAQIRRTRIEPHRSFTFENNVVYWENGKLLDGRWNELNVRFDNNVYWQANGKEPRFDNLAWKQWREKGMDAHGLIADPQFVDVAKKDFRLRDTSPALKLTKPIDLSRVGPQPAK